MHKFDPRKSLSREMQKQLYHIEKTNINNENIIKFFSLVDDGNISKITDFLNENNMPISARNDDGESVLHILIKSSNLYEWEKTKLIEFLIARNAPIMSYDKYNVTPLHLACKYQLYDVAKKLINGGADVNAIDNNNMTPLHYLITGKNVECSNNIVKDFIPKNISFEPELHTKLFDAIAKELFKELPQKNFMTHIKDLINVVPNMWKYDILDIVNKYDKLSRDVRFQSGGALENKLLNLQQEKIKKIYDFLMNKMTSAFTPIIIKKYDNGTYFPYENTEEIKQKIIIKNYIDDKNNYDLKKADLSGKFYSIIDFCLSEIQKIETNFFNIAQLGFNFMVNKGTDVKISKQIKQFVLRWNDPIIRTFGLPERYLRDINNFYLNYSRNNRGKYDGNIFNFTNLFCENINEKEKSIYVLHYPNLSNYDTVLHNDFIISNSISNYVNYLYTNIKKIKIPRIPEEQLKGKRKKKIPILRYPLTNDPEPLTGEKVRFRQISYQQPIFVSDINKFYFTEITKRLLLFMRDHFSKHIEEIKNPEKLVIILVSISASIYYIHTHKNKLLIRSDNIINVMNHLNDIFASDPYSYLFSYMILNAKEVKTHISNILTRIDELYQVILELFDNINNGIDLLNRYNAIDKLLGKINLDKKFNNINDYEFPIDVCCNNITKHVTKISNDITNFSMYNIKLFINITNITGQQKIFLFKKDLYEKYIPQYDSLYNINCYYSSVNTTESPIEYGFIIPRKYYNETNQKMFGNAEPRIRTINDDYNIIGRIGTKKVDNLMIYYGKTENDAYKKECLVQFKEILNNYIIMIKLRIMQFIYDSINNILKISSVQSSYYAPQPIQQPSKIVDLNELFKNDPHERIIYKEIKVIPNNGVCNISIKNQNATSQTCFWLSVIDILRNISEYKNQYIDINKIFETLENSRIINSNWEIDLNDYSIDVGNLHYMRKVYPTGKPFEAVLSTGEKIDETILDNIAQTIAMLEFSYIIGIDIIILKEFKHDACELEYQPLTKLLEINKNVIIKSKKKSTINNIYIYNDVTNSHFEPIMDKNKNEAGIIGYVGKMINDNFILKNELMNIFIKIESPVVVPKFCKNFDTIILRNDFRSSQGYEFEKKKQQAPSIPPTIPPTTAKLNPYAPPFVPKRRITGSEQQQTQNPHTSIIPQPIVQSQQQISSQEQQQTQNPYTSIIPQPIVQPQQQTSSQERQQTLSQSHPQASNIIPLTLVQAPTLGGMKNKMVGGVNENFESIIEDFTTKIKQDGTKISENDKLNIYNMVLKIVSEIFDQYIKYNLNNAIIKFLNTDTPNIDITDIIEKDFFVNINEIIDSIKDIYTTKTETNTDLLMFDSILGEEPKKEPNEYRIFNYSFGNENDKLCNIINLDIVNLLCEKTRNIINIPDTNGLTPLMYAIDKGIPSLVNRLINHNAIIKYDVGKKNINPIDFLLKNIKTQFNLFCDKENINLMEFNDDLYKKITDNYIKNLQDNKNIFASTKLIIPMLFCLLYNDFYQDLITHNRNELDKINKLIENLLHVNINENQTLPLSDNIKNTRGVKFLLHIYEKTKDKDKIENLTKNRGAIYDELLENLKNKIGLLYINQCGIENYNDLTKKINEIWKNDTQTYQQLWFNYLSNNKNLKNISNFHLIMMMIYQKSIDLYETKVFDEISLNKIIIVIHDIETILYNKYNDYLSLPSTFDANHILERIIAILEHVFKETIFTSLYATIVKTITHFINESKMEDKEDMDNLKDTLDSIINKKINLDSGEITLLTYIKNIITIKIIKKTLNVYATEYDPDKDETESVDKLYSGIVKIVQLITGVGEDSLLIKKIEEHVIPYFKNVIEEFLKYTKNIVDNYASFIIKEYNNSKILIDITNNLK